MGGLMEFFVVRLRPIGWSRTKGQEFSEKSTLSALSGHMAGGILRSAFPIGDEEPKSVHTLWLNSSTLETNPQEVIPGLKIKIARDY